MKYTNKIKHILFGLLVIIGSKAFAQQIYPVNLNGVIIPPYSVLLSDYANARSQDLMFTATLNDPVESNRQVYFRITVKHNGREIMQTDPNAAIPPMTLSQYSPEMLTGSELAMYLDARNLTGLRNNNRSNALPDGFNQICLEVMDYQRKVPISRQICVGGLFRLFEPPLVTIPENRKEVKPLPGQNLFFRWLPRHTGLPNAPNMVEYEFKLVQLLPGIGNANDAFDRAITIYQTTSMIPTLIYSEVQPLLETGKEYAWRVQVKDMMGAKVFQNNGYSKITTFRYGSSALADLIIPKGCSVVATDAPYVASPSNAEVGKLVVSEVAKLGFFDLEIDELQNNGGSYSGKGGIHVPFLKAYIKVAFSNLKVTKDKRVFELGTIEVEKDIPFGFSDAQLKPSQIASVLTNPFLNQLNNFFNSPSGGSRKVSNRNSQDKTRTGMPLVLDRKDKSGNNLPSVVLMDMKFSLKRGEMTAIAYQPLGGTNFDSYAGSSIAFTPKGVKKDATLILLNSKTIPQADDSKLTLNGRNQGTTPYTKAKCNCRGIAEFEINGQYEFSPKTLKPLNGNTQNIVTTLRGEGANLDDFLAETGTLAPFQLPTLANHTFETGKGKFDYSATKNNKNITLPIAIGKIDNSWKGFSFETANEKVPPSLDFSGKKEAITLTEGSLAITGNGVVSELSKTNIVSLKTGKVGQWPFAIDTLTVLVSNSKMDSILIKGKLKVPIIDEPFVYSGKLEKSANSGAFDIIVKAPPGKGTMSCWNGSLAYTSKTVVKAVSRLLNGNQKYIPYADLQGKFVAKFDDKTFRKYLTGNKPSKIARMKRALGVGDSIDLEIEQLDFEGLIIDPSLPGEQRYSLKQYDKKSPLVHVAGRTFPMTAAEVLYNPKTTDGHTEVGLKIILNSFDTQKIEAVVLGLDNQTSIAIWARKDVNGNYVLNRIETDTKFIDCDCL